MKFVGLHTQIRRNNTRSVLLLMAFPALILMGVYAVIYLLYGRQEGVYIEDINALFLRCFPIVFVVVGIWFTIAYFFHSSMIQSATHSKPLERREHMRVYNLTENLCMSVGMRMPKLYIIESEALNAFASGIHDKSFSITLTSGIINQLDDEELKGVIAHELSHIRNKDVRLLIVTIVFVGIFGVILDMAFRSLRLSSFSSSRNKGKGGGGGIIIAVLLVAVVLYFFSMIFKLALSRSREYMADAGAVGLTRNAQALADALKKVAGNSDLKTSNSEVKELFLDNSGKGKSKSFFAGIANLFATHPPIEKRIAVLENFK